MTAFIRARKINAATEKFWQAPAKFGGFFPAIPNVLDLYSGYFFIKPSRDPPKPKDFPFTLKRVDPKTDFWRNINLCFILITTLNFKE